MATIVKMRQMSDDWYAKRDFRMKMAALSFPEKVRKVVELQRRLVPIYAARGCTIVPW